MRFNSPMRWKVICNFSCLALSLQCGNSSFGQVDREHVNLAKTATVLVERPSGDGFGTAFCLDEKGFFITNEHVIRGETEKIPLIMNPGTKSEVKLLAEVVRKSVKKDLALLRVIHVPIELIALELGDDSGLLETQSITVFGYPFGTSLALNKKTYPNISVNVGRIASLRRVQVRSNQFRSTQ